MQGGRVDLPEGRIFDLQFEFERGCCSGRQLEAGARALGHDDTAVPQFNLAKKSRFRRTGVAHVGLDADGRGGFRRGQRAHEHPAAGDHAGTDFIGDMQRRIAAQFRAAVEAAVPAEIEVGVGLAGRHGGIVAVVEPQREGVRLVVTEGGSQIDLKGQEAAGVAAALGAVDQDHGGVHRRADVERAAARRRVRRPCDGALVFAFAEPVGAPIEVADERAVRQVHLHPRGCGRAFRGEPAEFPSAIQWE